MNRLSSFPLGLTLKPPEELLDPSATRVEPYYQPFVDKPKAAWLRESNSKVTDSILFEKLPHCDLLMEKTLIGKVRAYQLSGLNCMLLSFQ